MTAPRELRVIPAIMVAVVTVLALPLASRPMVRSTVTCCCPREQPCHCPGHGDPANPQASMRPCGRSFTVTLAPAVAGVVAVIAPLPVPTMVAAPAPVFALSAPHPTGWLPAPAAPS